MNEKRNNTAILPHGFEYLDNSLLVSQEHIFLINKRIDDLHLTDRIKNQKEIENLEYEKAQLIDAFEFYIELETEKSDPAIAKQVRQTASQQLSNEAYQAAEPKLQNSQKEYDPDYWSEVLKPKFDQLDYELSKSWKADDKNINDLFNNYNRDDYEVFE